MLEKVKEEFTSGADVHNEEKLLWVLERPVQLDQKWVIELFKDFALTNYRFDLVFIDKLESW